MFNYNYSGSGNIKYKQKQQNMTYATIILIVTGLLLMISLLVSPHNPYQEKNSSFECGFHSFLGQNRTQFSVSFFIFALLFLLFDLEILLVYPYVVSSYNNDIYGLLVIIIFFLVLVIGFAFELGKNALKIDSRQVFSLVKTISNLGIKTGYFKIFKIVKSLTSR